MPETVRADARRNRERIVAAASACFAADGMECQMSAIAKAAGVGAATIFRHFPAKRDLAVAVMRQRMAETEALLERERDNPDATAAVRTVLEHFVATMVSDRGLKQAAMGEVMEIQEDLLAKRDAMFERVAELLARAKDEGGLRAEVELVDLIVLSQGVAHAAGPLEETAPGSWRRFLALATRGLFTDGGAAELPEHATDPVDALEAGH